MDAKLFLGWGDATDAETRGAPAKAATAAYVAGPKVPCSSSEQVHFLLQVTDWKDSTELFVKCEESHDGATWFPVPAGTALSGIVPGELRSEVLPFVQHYKKTTGNEIAIDFGPIKAAYVRLQLKADAVVPEGALVLVLAFV